MPPKLVSDDGRYVVIRPLAYCKEQDIQAYAEDQAFPIIPCNLCGSQPNLKRAEIKAMIQEWETRFPGRVDNLFRGLKHVVPSHLLDTELFPFESPSPEELLQYRSEHPLADDFDVTDPLAEAALNPWVQAVEPESDQAQDIIIKTGVKVQRP
jgi:Predicted ATPase of the PP-loop superfamily implicated in cell cycle control